MTQGLEEDRPEAFGILAETGLPLPGVSDEAVAAMLGGIALPPPPASTRTKQLAYAVIGDVDSRDLSQCGWGVIFAAGVTQAVKDALSPLIQHRKSCATPFVTYDGDASVGPDESAVAWLARHGVRMDVVDPALGVPFYLLIVGPPDAISFDFQYSLDVYWAVGRLWFETADEFSRYAESVVRYETAARVATSRNVALFATEHDFDRATQLFTRNVALPLSQGDGAIAAIGKRQNFGLQPFLGKDATKDNFAKILRGSPGEGTPSLLFSGSHGMQFNLDDARQFSTQGAVVCQDWPGYGEITEEHWFAATDVPSNAAMEGMMYIFYACHGAGCTEIDGFDRLNNQPRRIASKAFLSQLPARLLAHENGGALAILAHVERAWSYSFQGGKGVSQTQGFRDVIGRLLRGDRIGQATDVFNTRWTALSAELAEEHLALEHGQDVSLANLGRLWVARDDARNFVVLGDPAVRLRVEDI